MPTLCDLTGKRFGRLVVLERAENGVCSGKPTTRWVCVCDCGNVVSVESHNLRRGGTRSCGCLKEKRYSEIGESAIHYVHGGSKTRLYRIWRGMKTRCLNDENPAYKNYGGRGISICSEWADDFPAFRDWALSHGYREDLSIDRIDVNGNYCPENCRWATSEQQANNMQNTIRIEIGGVTHSLAEWSKISGISYSALRERIKLGWKCDDLLRPVKNGRKA